MLSREQNPVLFSGQSAVAVSGCSKEKSCKNHPGDFSGTGRLAQCAKGEAGKFPVCGIGLERGKGIGQVGKKGQQQRRPADGRAQQKRKPLPSQTQQYSRQKDQGQQFYHDCAGKCASCQEQARKVFASWLSLSSGRYEIFRLWRRGFPDHQGKGGEEKENSRCVDVAGRRDLEDRQRMPGIQRGLPARLAKCCQQTDDTYAASQVENDQQQLDADYPSAEKCSRGKDQLRCGRIDGDESGMVYQLLQAGKGFGCRLNEAGRCRVRVAARQEGQPVPQVAVDVVGEFR